MTLGTPEQSPGAIRVPPDVLIAFVAKLFAAQGCPEDDAREIASGLVEADLRGVWSHGVARVPGYLSRYRAGVMNPRPQVKFETEAASAVHVDGDNGSGLVVAPKAMEAAIALAQANGIGMAGVANSNHFGAAARYAEMAARAFCIGMVFTNSSPALAPWGGAKPFLGTSPLAFAAPTPEGKTFVLDMAMSRIARGKLKFAAARGESVPEGYALDKDGRPTTDGAAAFSGTMLPFGEHKGAALSWMMEIMGGVLTGAAFGGAVANPFTGLDRPADTGHTMIAIRADIFMPRAAFGNRIGTLDDRAKALPRAHGFDEIMSPGEPEARRRAQNERDGVPLPKAVVDDLAAEGARAGIDVPLPR